MRDQYIKELEKENRIWCLTNCILLFLAIIMPSVLSNLRLGKNIVEFLGGMWFVTVCILPVSVYFQEVLVRKLLGNLKLKEKYRLKAIGNLKNWIEKI